MGRAKSKAYDHLIVELYKIKLGVTDITFRDVLYKLYIEDEMSIRDISKEFKISTSTVHDWLKSEGITRRKPRC